MTRSIFDPRFQIPGQWTPPQPRSEIEAMLAVPVKLPADDLPQPPCDVEED